MSIKIMTQVWETADSKGSELLLLLALADSANDQGVCWPSLPTLAKKTRMSRRYVIGLINSLVEKGWVKRIDTSGEKYKNSTVYRITPVNPAAPLPEIGGEAGSTPEVNPSSPPSEAGSTPPVNPAAPNPLVNHQKTINEPSAAVVNIFKLYENTVGMLTPMMADELRQAEKDYPAEWLPEAFLKAEKANVRKWTYIRAILENWKTDGRGAPQHKAAKVTKFEPILE